MDRQKREPKLTHHKATGQWYVRVNGVCHYLGSDRKKAELERLRILLEWRATGGAFAERPPQAEITVLEVFARFAVWAREYYQSNPATWRTMKAGFRPFLDLHGDTPAVKFGPRALKLYREALIRDDFREDLDAAPRLPVRGTVNQRVREIVRVFKFAASEELIPSSVPEALKCVEPLRMGRSRARESKAVRPVAWEHVEMTLPHLPGPVRTLILLCWHTGCRIGELLEMRPGDIKKDGEVWEYTPPTHKNAWRGKSRSILFGPAAQRVLREAIMRALPGEPVCSPRQTPMEKRERSTVHRRVNQKPNPRKTDRTLNSCYESQDINRAVRRAVDSLNAARKAEGLELIGPWHVHQIRHSFATRARAAYGAELARAVLGHSTLAATEIYAEADAVQARAVIAGLG